MCHEVFDDKCCNKMAAKCCALYGSAACIYHITTDVLKDCRTRIAMLEMYLISKRRASDYDNLIRNALQHGLSESETTTTNGKCLFYCLAVQLSRTLNRQINPDIVRREIVEFLRANSYTSNGMHLQTFILRNDLDN